MAPDASSETYIAIGRILAPHGVRGEIKVESMTDFPARFAVGSNLLVEGESRSRAVIQSRPHKEALLLRLAGIDNRTQAELLRDRHLLLPRHEATPLPAGEYYSDEIEGLAVITMDGRPLGNLVEVLWTAANEVYVVDGDYGEILVPATSEVVQEVDLGRGIMVVKLLPGLAPELEGDLG
ncbi:MAG: 16S rRNA processing protein RimM [Caldilineales bacterium]|nr:16S rRNA processing protein RimM [Caldilineales bacterium]